MTWLWAFVLHKTGMYCVPGLLEIAKGIFLHASLLNLFKVLMRECM